jgi:hypothetical protein
MYGTGYRTGKVGSGSDPLKFSTKLDGKFMSSKLISKHTLIAKHKVNTVALNKMTYFGLRQEIMTYEHIKSI